MGPTPSSLSKSTTLYCNLNFKSVFSEGKYKIESASFNVVRQYLVSCFAKLLSDFCQNVNIETKTNLNYLAFLMIHVKLLKDITNISFKE